jgi:mono/diheme cytochrome c family protein
MHVTWIAAFTALCLAINLVEISWAQGSDLGKDEYMRSCQPCHGTDGRGDGQTAKHLAKRPTDLTKLSESNGGVFPFVRAFETIDGRLEVALHGPREMPVWGDRYKRELISEVPRGAVSDDMANVLARRRIMEFIEYFSTIQTK